MAVIINELEVVVEAPAAAAPAAGGAGAAPAGASASAPRLAPRDLADVAERRLRHAARLFAH